MSIITKLKIENKISNLENNIKKFRSINDLLDFQIIIHNSIKLLLSISKIIKDKNNFYGTKLSDELLINTISFLPSKYILICQNVCTTWLKSLKSNLSKKLLQLIPKILLYKTYFNSSFPLKTMTIQKKYLYLSNYFNSLRIDIESYKLKKIYNKELQTELISSNNNYICVHNFDKINILSLDLKLINLIPIEKIQGLAIDNNNNILISTYNKFYIYSIKGELIKSWELVENLELIGSRNIAFIDNEIFMVDTLFNRINVFSYEGNLIRFWGSKGSEPGHFVSPRGIAIYHNVVFISDIGNDKIQVFTRDGKFIFAECNENSLGNIVISHGRIYVDFLGGNYVKIYNLIM